MLLRIIYSLPFSNYLPRTEKKILYHDISIWVHHQSSALDVQDNEATKENPPSHPAISYSSTQKIFYIPLNYQPRTMLILLLFLCRSAGPKRSRRLSSHIPSIVQTHKKTPQEKNKDVRSEQGKQMLVNSIMIPLSVYRIPTRKELRLDYKVEPYSEPWTYYLSTITNNHHYASPFDLIYSNGSEEL